MVKKLTQFSGSFFFVVSVIVSIGLSPVSAVAQQSGTSAELTDAIALDVATIEGQAALAAETAAILKTEAEAKAIAATEAVIAASEVVASAATSAKAAAAAEAAATTIAAAEIVAAAAAEAVAAAAEAVAASAEATEAAAVAEAEAAFLAAEATAAAEPEPAGASDARQNQQYLEVQTDEIELRSADGFVALTGVIVGFDDTLITIRTSSGVVGIENDKIECIGTACPLELLTNP
jgi:chemotaxis protein histidine kinase CheA